VCEQRQQQGLRQTVQDVQGEMQNAKEALCSMEAQAGAKDADIASMTALVGKHEGSVAHSKAEQEKTRKAMIQLSTSLSQLQAELEAKSNENEQVKAMCAELIASQEELV
jgi:chromosome segregation ATPase